jgi:hypothetical protein
VVELGKKTGVPTPLNAKIMELVHQVEQTGTFFNALYVQFYFRLVEPRPATLPRPAPMV